MTNNWKKHYYGENHEKQKERRRLANRKFRKEHPEIEIERRKKHQKTMKYKYNHFKSQAKRRGLEFSVSIEEYEDIIKRPCIYCGFNEHYVGIDRVDNSIGYTLMNSSPCCLTCNIMKRHHTKEHFINHCQKIVENNKTLVVEPYEVELE